MAPLSGRREGDLNRPPSAPRSVVTEAREAGQPERIWKAIYHHYLPDAIGPDAPPARQQLGDAAVTWAAISLADKLDTVVGMFFAGERPTGSRDPFALRRAALGIIRIVVENRIRRCQ